MGEKDMHESELNAAQPARHPRKKKRGRAGKAIRKTVKIVVVLVLAVGAGLFGLKAYIGKQAEENQSESYSRAAVTRGAMEETVYGTGTTAARNQTNVLAGADGTLTDLRVSVGDEVKAGDILAVLTNADLDDEITDLEFDLWELDDTILDTGTGSKVTAVEAPAAGRVMAVYAGVGDDALAVFRREGALAVISTDGRMKVELSGVDAGAGVALNDKLVVTGENFTAEGTVVDLTRQGTSLTLTIQDDSLPMGETVSVATADGVALGTGTLAVNKPMAVSSYGGTIESVRTEVGKTVKRGDTLFKLTDSPAARDGQQSAGGCEGAAREPDRACAVRRHDCHAGCERGRRNRQRRADVLHPRGRGHEPDHRRGRIGRGGGRRRPEGQNYGGRALRRGDGRRGLQNRPGRQQFRRRDDLRRGADV